MESSVQAQRTAAINQYGEIVWPRELTPPEHTRLAEMKLRTHQYFTNSYVSHPENAQKVKAIRRFALQNQIEIRPNFEMGLSINKPQALEDYFLDRRFAMSSAETSSVQLSQKLQQQPSPLILAGIEYALHVPRCFISDPQATDRLAIALIAIHETMSYPCILVYREAEREFVVNQIAAWLPREIEVLNFKNATQQLSKKYIWLLGYHELERQIIERTDKPKHWSVIVDHGHMAKNPFSHRSEELFALTQGITHCFLLTEFQVNRSEKDLWGLLKVLKKRDEFIEYKKFLLEAPDIPTQVRTSNFSNDQRELYRRGLYGLLRSTCMLRRADDAGLAVQESVKYIPLDENPNGSVRSAWRRLGLRKINGANQWLEDWFAKHIAKTLIIVHHNEVADGIAAAHGFNIIYGRKGSPQQRERFLNEFLDPHGSQALILSKDAVLPIMDLSAIQAVVFVEPPHTPHQVASILDNIVSTPKEEQLRVYYLIVDHPIDYRALANLDWRKRMHRTTVDGRLE